MFAACPTSSAKNEDRRSAVFMIEWSVGNTDRPHLISTINGDRKALTTESLMIGHHSHWFALNYILWLKHLRADKDAQDQKNNQQSPGARNKISPSVFRGVTIVRHGGIRAHISRGPRWYRVKSEPSSRDCNQGWWH